ncbi:MAG: hypothetical protein L0H31_05915, partial [Nocardioidaceae bacterium]|nr:hypothetical protein [Nocardioidaceae bacterium]
MGRAPATPPSTDPLTIDETQSARRHTVRVIFSIKRLTVPAAILAVVHQVGEALVPVIMGVAIDRGLAESDASQFVLWMLVLGIDFLLLS